jgi:hypothetical protein|tara:strand:+ start:3224 stop:3541 length:318 start_codon:yes stop_codon:yes gene_type:complete
MKAEYWRDAAGRLRACRSQDIHELKDRKGEELARLGVLVLHATWTINPVIEAQAQIFEELAFFREQMAAHREEIAFLREELAFQRKKSREMEEVKEILGAHGLHL